MIKGNGELKIKAMLGPGHNPPTPQPRPKNAEPTKSFWSISFFKGKKNWSENSGVCNLKINRYPTVVVIIAPSITNAREGSHDPKKSRNDWTLKGLSMPDTASPMPNKIPEKRLNIILIIRLSSQL